VLRQLERWLHQHIFKVGWLLTKNFQTTTILYYTFFLPGVVLNQFTVWLVAGIVNVRADRAIQWPEPQEIAELRLNFIRLAKGVGRFKLALIALSPLLVGIGFIWLIASQALNISDVISVAGGGLDAVLAAIPRLVAVPDFWLWVYLVFAIGNTMMPDLKALRGLRVILWILLAATAAVVVIGVGSEVLGRLLSGPVAGALNLLAGAFAVIIAIDLFAVAFLGAVEAVIERVTGDSATFEKGKLVAITRKELLEQKKKQAARAASANSRAASESGPPSIYRLPLPIPGGPGQGAVAPPAAAVLPVADPSPQQPAAAPRPPADDRAGPDVIEGRAVARPMPATAPPQRPLPPPQPAQPRQDAADNDSDDDPDAITYVDIDELV